MLFQPGPIPGMRPTMGGAGKVVPPPKQTTGTMGLIMPIYTTGIVILFTYTVMKVRYLNLFYLLVFSGMIRKLSSLVYIEYSFDYDKESISF